MKLHEYFSSQKEISLESGRKVALYEDIMHKTHAPVSVFARMSFYTKVALYTFVGLVFLASLYLPYFSSLVRQSDGVVTSSPGGIGVQADYIAQIIETKWDIEIYDKWEKVESSLFRVGDRIVLWAGTEIVFHITTIAQAKVIGPAEFHIEKIEQGYSIQLVRWQYVELQSLKDEQNMQPSESVFLQSSRVSIKPKHAENVHFTYTEDGDNAIIDNQWDGSLVVAKSDDEQQQEELAKHSTASLGSGRDLFDLTITTGERLSPVEVAKVLRNAPQQVADTKKLISGEQHNTIKAILSAEFLAADIQNVTSSYLKGEARAYETAFVNLYGKVEQIYLLMGISVPQYISDARYTHSLKVLITMIEDLLQQMDEQFYVAQSHPARLKKLLGWLYALREENFGSQDDTALSGSSLVGTLNLDDYKDLLGK